MPPDIPNRSLFRPPEVCEIAQVQPYVLRSWEAEFPDLGVSKGGIRVYRRRDLDRVLRIKELLFVEGLTLAGARRRLVEEGPGESADATPLEDLLGSDARERLQQVKSGLRGILQMLSTRPGDGAPGGPVEARAASKRGSVGRASPSAARRAARPARKSPRSAARHR
jgi:DNA-binding transcriptional MerR regulator